MNTRDEKFFVHKIDVNINEYVAYNVKLYPDIFPPLQIKTRTLHNQLTTGFINTSCNLKFFVSGVVINGCNTSTKLDNVIQNLRACGVIGMETNVDTKCIMRPLYA